MNKWAALLGVAGFAAMAAIAVAAEWRKAHQQKGLRLTDGVVMICRAYELEAGAGGASADIGAGGRP